MWDEITYPFSNFNGATVEVWEWRSNFIPYFTGHVITYPMRKIMAMDAQGNNYISNSCWLSCWNLLGKQSTFLSFFTFREWMELKSSPWNTITHSFCTVNTVDADGLSVKGAEASVTMVLRSQKGYQTGPRLIIKPVFLSYGDSHVKDKTVAIPSYL